MTDYTIGADISKDHIDLHRWPDGAERRVSNDKAGFAAIVKWLASAPVERVVFEPTGAYHKAFERFLGQHELPLCKINPRQVRRFAEAIGKLAKTDRADAALLARFGAMVRPEIRPAPSQIINSLKELYIARQALVKDRTAGKNRGKTLTIALLKQHNSRRLDRIKSEIADIDRAIQALIGSDCALKHRLEVLISIPGISKITAFAMLIEMPELGTLDEKAVASLAGLAPVARQSGAWTGRAFIRGGRAMLRQALYMPALVASRFNPDLTRKYQALIAAGKPAKLAITAIMRKLLILANALLRDGRKWSQKTA